MECPWDRSDPDGCIGYQTPQCWQQCQGERNLRDAMNMADHRLARQQTTFDYIDEMYGRESV
jgi:hypothetical protein